MSDAELDAELDRFVRERGNIRPDNDPPPGPGGPAPPPLAGDLATGPEPAGDDDPATAPDDFDAARMKCEIADVRRQLDELQAGAADPEPDPDRPAPWYETDPDNPPGVLDQWRTPQW